MALSFLFRKIKKFPKEKVLNFTKKEEFPNLLKTLEKESPEEYQEVNQNLVFTFSKLLEGEDVENTLKSLEKSESVEKMMFLCHLYLDEKMLKRDERKTREILNRIFELNPNFASEHASDIYFKLKDFEECQKYLSFSENKNFYKGYLYYSGDGGHKKNVKLAVTYFIKDKNNPKSLYNLGTIYHNGLIGHKIDYTKAFHYFKKSYELGDIDSISYLGNMYLVGKGCEKDIQKGLEILKENESDPNCCFALGKYYFKKDYEKSFEYLFYAFQNGINNSTTYLGEFYFRALPPIKVKDYQTAKKFFETEPNRGSYFFLGLIYFEGYSVDKNYQKALIYFQKSLKIGQIKSTIYLSEMYLKGLGCQKDIPKGIEYLEIAAKKFKKQKEDLGIIYLNGKYVEKDENKGLSILKEINSDKSNFYIGKYYFQKNDYEKSLEYFNKIENKTEEVISMLGIMNEKQKEFAKELFQLGISYKTGKLGQKDLKKSFEYFQQSFEKGYSKAESDLAQMIIKGEGCEKDIPKGIEILEKLNDLNSLFSLGLYYYDGTIEVDWKKSFEYFTKSLEKGNKKAATFLGNFYFKGLPPIFKKDFLKAKEYYEMNLNDSIALRSLGIIHFYEIIDYQKSFEYFTKSLKLKPDKNVYKYLSKMYLGGLGVEKNEMKGRELLEKYNKKDNKRNEPSVFEIMYIEKWNELIE